VIADSQYSDPANQKRGERDILRVDKKYRTYGPEEQRSEYHKRPHIEAVYSFLKTQYSLTANKARGATNVASYALYSLLCLILNRTAENIGRQTKQHQQRTSTHNIGTRQRFSLNQRLSRVGLWLLRFAWQFL
jgi:hypothetical protein